MDNKIINIAESTLEELNAISKDNDIPMSCLLNDTIAMLLFKYKENEGKDSFVYPVEEEKIITPENESEVEYGVKGK